MRKQIIILVCLALAATWTSHGSAGVTPGTFSLKSLLPANLELQGWVAEGPPEVVKGEDLYLLINGGAEVYHEYGFQQALAISFKNGSGKYINLEIYQMRGDASAYGIFSFKTGIGGNKIPIGQEAMLEDYYLNFWRGNFVITLIGFDTSETSVQGIIAIANAIDRKIPKSGKKPPLINLLDSMETKATKVKYIRGNLGLFNHYRFEPANIFGVTEGVISIYPEFTQFIFQYKNSKEREQWLQNGLHKLNKNPQFKGYSPSAQIPGFTDKSNQTFIISAAKNKILISMGKHRKNLLPIHTKTLRILESTPAKGP